MAVHDQSLRSVEFVQHWVNSLPPLNESERRSPPSSITSPSTYSSSSRPSMSPSSTKSFEDGDSSRLRPTGIEASIHSSKQHSPVFEDAQKPHREATTERPKLVRCLTSSTDRRQHFGRKDSRLSWMHSNYSSLHSNESSSIDLLLEERRANPEQILMNLGFGANDQSIGTRLPVRFLAGETQANGINMHSFMQGHPELGRFRATESVLAMGELYSRLPPYYRQVATTDEHTSLHKQFSLNSLEMQSEHSSGAPLTVHRSEDGTMFASILTKSNTEQLAKQGFYSEHSSPTRLVQQSSVSSMSTHDCTIDSIDTPSPIVLNNSPSSESSRNPFISTQSSGSDSVFSSTESYTVDRRLRAKLEAIHEKTLNEMCEDDLEEGISFVCRRHSDSDLVQQTDAICVEEPAEEINIHEKRKAFARMKSYSFDEERLTQMLRDKLESCTVNENIFVPDRTAPVIVTTTDTCCDAVTEPVLPKQAEGLLQVQFNPESFDSIDSDTGTLVPSPYASPYQGMSPSTSRNGSLSVIPAMESFELEEVQSCDAGTGAAEYQTSPQPTSRRKRVRLQRSVSQRSDSDSSGIADIDCKSTREQNDSPASSSVPPGDVAESDGTQSTQDVQSAYGARSCYLTLPTFSLKDNSISSSEQTLNSINTTRTATTCRTLLPACASRPRRSSDSDATDLKYYSVSSAASSAGYPQSPYSFDSVHKQYSETSTQTDLCECSCCGHPLTLDQSIYATDWHINNLPDPNCSNSTAAHTSGDDTGDISSERSSVGADTAATQPSFYIVNTGDDDDLSLQDSSEISASLYSRSERNTSTSSSQDHKVEEACAEMTQDLNILRRLFAKYNIDEASAGKEAAIKQEILSSIQLAKRVLSPETIPQYHRSCSGHSAESLQCSTFVPISVSSKESISASKCRSKKAEPLLPRADEEDSHTCRSHGQRANYSDCPQRQRGYGSVDSAPVSIQSTPNSYTPSSVSSSMSRVSDQLKLTERQLQYECA